MRTHGVIGQQLSPPLSDHPQTTKHEQVVLEGGEGVGGEHLVYLTTKDVSDTEVKCLIASLLPKHAQQVR